LPHSRTEEHIFASWFRTVSNHKTIGMHLQPERHGTAVEMAAYPDSAGCERRLQEV
jgi:hypothetical protein